MKTIAKICGIQDVETVKVAVNAGADMVGIILVPGRPRTVSLETAQAISEYVHSLPEPRAQLVGVFRNQSLDEIEKLRQQIGLDVVQLHGSESLELLKSVKGPKIRRIAPSSKHFVTDARTLSSLRDVRILVDSDMGGDGKLVKWDLLQQISILGAEYILAGGLNPDNVGVAVLQPGCIGVDVSSGVETKGHKDPKKIMKFVSEAHKDPDPSTMDQ